MHSACFRFAARGRRAHGCGLAGRSRLALHVRTRWECGLRPAGAECRDVAQAEAKESEFVAPRPTHDGPWLEIRPGDETLFAVEATQGRANMGNPFRYKSYKGTQHRGVISGA